MHRTSLERPQGRKEGRSNATERAASGGMGDRQTV
jgi:hypothetical protein